MSFFPRNSVNFYCATSSLAYGHFRTSGGGDFLSLLEKIAQFPNAWLLKSWYKSTKIVRKKIKLVHNLPSGGKFFLDFGFPRFCGKQNREFGFQTLLVGIAFRGFHVQYLKVTKMDAIWSFSLHCLQPILLKFSNVKKGVNFCWIFVGRSLLSRNKDIAEQWKICEIRDN